MQGFLSYWTGLPPRKQAILAVALVAAIAAFVAIARMATSPRMVLLYGGLDPAAAGEVVQALVKAVQMDKRRRLPQHADFYAVTANQPVTVNLPVELIGVAIGTRDGGQLDVQRREVQISVLPRLIPGTIEIDISGLAIGDSLHVRDLRAFLPAEAEILDDLDLAIVAVVPPRLAVEDEEEVEEEAEPEVISRGAEDEED